MLRSLALITVRQQQRQPAQPAPLGLAGGDELVDYHLRAVDEIPELRFPDHQIVRAGRGIAVLEADHRFFGQYRVDHREAGLAVADVLQWNETPTGVLIMQHRVAVKKRPATAVLAGDTHRNTLIEQR